MLIAHLFWPILIAVACGSFMLGVRVEGYRWRRRCNDVLNAMEVMKQKNTTAQQRRRQAAEEAIAGKQNAAERTD